MPFQFTINPPTSALQTIQAVEAIEGSRERRQTQRELAQVRMQEAMAKMDERQRARVQQGLDGMARVAGASRNAQEWDDGIRALVAQGFPEMHGELGKYSPDRAAFTLRQAQDSKTLFEHSPAQRQARLDFERDKFNATLPGRMAVAQIGKPVSTTQVFMAGENEFEKKYRGGQAEDALEIGKAANAARSLAGRLQQLEGLTRDFETGKLAPARTTISAWAQAIGMSPDAMAKIGLRPEDAVTGQSIEAITNALTVGMIGSGGFPANNFSDADRAFLQQTVPQLSKTPGANIIVSQSMKAAADRNIEKERQWLAARRAGVNYDTFSEQWSAYVDKTPLFPVVQSADDYGRLKSRSVFTDPQGIVRIKP